MITTVPMELVSFLVIKDKVQEIASRLVALGVFHPVDIRSIEDKLDKLSSFEIEKESSDFDLLQSKVNEVARKLKLDLRGAYESDIRDFSYQSAQEFLEALDKEIAPILEQIIDFKGQVSQDEMILTHVREYLPFPVRRNSLYSFLYVSTGKIEEKNIAVIEKSLLDIPHVIYPFRKEGSWVYSIFIGLRRDRALLDKVLRDVAWEEIEYPKDADSVSKEAQEKLAHKIQETKGRVLEFESRVKSLAGQKRAELVRISSAISVHKSLLEAKRYGCTTEKTALFSGWVPKDQKEQFIARMRSTIDISYVESRAAETVDIPKDEIPVLTRHNAALRPFDLLVSTYGIPRYGTVDPTIFVAIMFLVMFGVMFGDYGHGAILAILGFLLRRNRQTQVKAAGTLMVYSGLSAVLFGLLYGSVFGVEVRPLWLKPTESAMYLFSLSLFFGIGVISLGIVINVINALRDKDYLKVLFDKAGLIAGLVYWAGIGVITKLVVDHTPASALLVNIVIGGFIILFLGPMIKFVLQRHGSNFFEAFMHGLVEVLEVGMGYLANTISFLRIAGFALTHACLFLAIFELSKGLKGIPGASVLILVVGNFIVFCLEGLVVTMQSVRLNYYEFFSKFFIPGKRKYKPLTIPGIESINR